MNIWLCKDKNLNKSKYTFRVKSVSYDLDHVLPVYLISNGVGYQVHWIFRVNFLKEEMCVAKEKKKKSIDSYDDEVYHSKVGVQSIYVNDIEDGGSKSHQGLKRSDSSEYLRINFIKIAIIFKNGR